MSDVKLVGLVAYCDFDDEWCLYNPMVDMLNTWQLFDYQTPETGSEVRKEALAQQGDVITGAHILSSEMMTPKTQACLRFSYRMWKAAATLSYLNAYTIQVIFLIISPPLSFYPVKWNYIKKHTK